MRRSRLPLAILCGAVLPVAFGAGVACRNEPAVLVGGIQVNEPDAERWMATLVARGMNAVAVTVYAHQGDWDSWNLWFNGWSEGMPDPRPPDPGVVAEIRAARRHGLAVALVLRVALDHAFPRNAFLWHGMIQPLADADLDEWFRRYRTFVNQWSEIAQREGVTLLAVASELNSLASTRPLGEPPALAEWYLNAAKQAERRARLLGAAGEVAAPALRDPAAGEFADLATFLDARTAAERAWAAAATHAGAPDRIARLNRRRLALDRHWRRVIAGARERFSGALTFAANFDQYGDISFWDDLDVLGINAYFQIRPTWRPSPDAWDLRADLAAGWRRRLAQIDAFRRSLGRPSMRVVLTELGYTWRAESTLEPWAMEGVSVVPAPGEPGGQKALAFAAQPADPGERALAVRALREAELSFDPALLGGILYWKLSTVPSHAAVEPFVLLLDGPFEDPLLGELLAFREDRRLARWTDRLRRRLAPPAAGG